MALSHDTANQMLEFYLKKTIASLLLSWTVLFSLIVRMAFKTSNGGQLHFRTLVPWLRSSNINVVSIWIAAVGSERPGVSIVHQEYTRCSNLDLCLRSSADVRGYSYYIMSYQSHTCCRQKILNTALYTGLCKFWYLTP